MTHSASGVRSHPTLSSLEAHEQCVEQQVEALCKLV